MRSLVQWVLAAGAVGIFAASGCGTKIEASDKICTPNQKVRCNNCAKDDPSDTRTYRGWQQCSADGKSFVGQCSECAPDDTGSTSGDIIKGPTDPPPVTHKDAGSPTGSEVPEGGVVPGRGAEGGAGGDCAGALAAGNLAIVEIMMAGTDTSFGGDDWNEWFEVQNTQNCRVNVKGLMISATAALSAQVDQVTMTDDVWLGPGETFVIANTLDSDKNLQLPGRVFAWDAPRANVLGDKVDHSLVLAFNRVEIDRRDWNASTWYAPAGPMAYGASISFSVGCTWGERSSWGNWRVSSHVYGSSPDQGPSLLGTPNAPNDDVPCPHDNAP